MKVKNSDLVKLLATYGKFVTASLEEEFFDMGYELTKDAVAIEEALKPYHKLQEKLQKSVQEADADKKEELLEKANKELNAAFEKEVEIKDFSKVTKDFIFKNKVKLTGFEIKLLKDFKILD